MGAVSAGSAFTVALVYYIFYLLNSLYAHAFITRPIVVCPILGMVLGKPDVGLAVGAQLEAIFMGITNIGGSIPSDVFIAGTVVCAVVCLTGVDIEVGMSLATIVGVVGAMLSLSVRLFITGSLVQVWDNLAAAGKDKAYVTSAVIYTFILPLVNTIVIYVAVAAGATQLENFLNSIPEFIRTGMSVAAGMMPAVGICLLMNMLWSGKYAIYFIFGFALTVYTGLNMTAMVFIALFITVVQVFTQMDIRAIAASSGGGGEDDLFD
ncbi:PTS sugar transporter subunit IIC [Eubacteriales bacterium OttesenSCG-928-M02]|nr:PTS sugar transporter subunit IIC [Eubacteriales bacterium OttesenSCG-928-M02]